MVFSNDTVHSSTSGWWRFAASAVLRTARHRCAERQRGLRCARALIHDELGKTSTIFALAKQIYGKNFRSMILEVSPKEARCAPNRAVHSRAVLSAVERLRRTWYRRCTRSNQNFRRHTNALLQRLQTRHSRRSRRHDSTRASSIEKSY